MICYRPTEGDVSSVPISYRPRTCFLMTQIGKPVPTIAQEIRRRIKSNLSSAGFGLIDSGSQVTGRDFLMKIWNLMLSVPLGIAIIHEDISMKTYANIFYELGVMQAYGKETLVVKTTAANVPSDFVRTEYVNYDEDFDKNFNKFIEGLSSQADYYVKISDQLEKDPLLAIDYLRRAYLITNERSHQIHAEGHFESASIQDRAKSSVELLLISFTNINAR